MSMTQEAPPAKLTLPKAKIEALAVNTQQWGTAAAAAAAAAPASKAAKGGTHSEQLAGFGYNVFFDPVNAAPAKPAAAPVKAAADVAAAAAPAAAPAAAVVAVDTSSGHWQVRLG